MPPVEQKNVLSRAMTRHAAEAETGKRKLTFPKDFLWGAATSSHQVEGDNIYNDWWAWEQAGHVPFSSGKACDQYNRYEQDFDLAVSMGHKAHRFSIEWSRIEPRRGEWDEAATQHYVDMVDALLERGLEPIVSLHHFTNPQWFTMQGGWIDSRSVDLFARYVRHIVKAIGPRVKYWLTINEPMVYVQTHFVDGGGPPGAKTLPEAIKVIEHLIRAHAAAYAIVHQEIPAEKNPMVSCAKNIPVFEPKRLWSPLDRGVTWLTDRLFSGSFLDAITEGVWHVPGLKKMNLPEAADTLDYLGVNYYSRHFIECKLPFKVWIGHNTDIKRMGDRVTETSDLGWDVCPDAFHRTLMRASKLEKPILITENGTYMDDDARRWRFIVRHLESVWRAIQDGADIRGFCYWSLLDNYEWIHGFKPRFGIVEVDYQTQERRIKFSGQQYSKVCKSNQLLV